MPFTFILDGFQIVADSPSEAAALLKSLRADAAKVAAPAPAPAPASRQPWRSAPLPPQVAAADASITSPLILTAEFLDAIRSARPGHVGSAEMQKALHAEHPKGIGSKAAIVNQQLTKLAGNIHNVYTMDVFGLPAR